MMVSSLLVGIQNMVDMVYQTGGYMTEKLGGFSKLDDSCRLYLVVASIAMQPVHEFSLKMLEDDRFLKFGGALRQGMCEEANKVMAIDAGDWDILAKLCPTAAVDGMALRGHAVQAMHTSIGYVHSHSFQLLDNFPLKLTQGCVSTNIEELGCYMGGVNSNKFRKQSAGVLLLIWCVCKL